jgi:hypothetical protein
MCAKERFLSKDLIHALFIAILGFSMTQSCKTMVPTQIITAGQSERFFKGFAYSGKFLDVSDETEDARATFWKPDGTIIFIVGRISNNLVAYKVNEPWQVNSAEFLDQINIPGAFQHGIHFRDDGKMLWIFDRTSIWSYNLETAWDITTISDGLNTDLSAFMQRGHDIDFKPDGTILFIDDRNVGAIFELSLSTPWDVTTATLSFTLDISDQQKEVRGVEFIKDGEIMMLMDTGRNEVLQYNLTKPWDISTAVFFDTYDVSTLTSQGRGLSFNANENIIYITGRDEKKVFQLEIPTP